MSAQYSEAGASGHATIAEASSRNGRRSLHHTARGRVNKGCLLTAAPAPTKQFVLQSSTRPRPRIASQHAREVHHPRQTGRLQVADMTRDQRATSHRS